MRHFAVSAVGKDRPGIVAAVSEVLLRHEGNIEDSQMTILRGHFTMTLVVSVADGTDADLLRADLEQVRERLGLEALSVSEVTELEPGAEAAPSHIVSVYGADHPGILHAVSVALAQRQVNITDLTTRLVAGKESEPLYAMMMEVTLPASARLDEVERALRAVGAEQGVELSIRPLEQDAL